MSDAIDLARLAEPFPARDVEWRIGQCGTGREGKVWAKVLAYVTNRAIMDRLDDVVGPHHWRNDFREWTVGGQPGVLCGLSVRCPREDGYDEWVTKWDGAENTDIEAVKGGLSGAMKRAAVQWGIGRYLYDLEEGWAVIVEDNRDKQANYAKTKEGATFYWKPPPLPTWALPQGHEPPPADSREANTLSPREQAAARAAHPPPPPEPHATAAEFEHLRTLAAELGLDVVRWNRAWGSLGIKRRAGLRQKHLEPLALELHRQAVEGLLLGLALNLDDVRAENAAVVADVPAELDLEQAQAALTVLRACKERQAVSA